MAERLFGSIRQERFGATEEVTLGVIDADGAQGCQDIGILDEFGDGPASGEMRDLVDHLDGQPWTYNGFSTNWDKLKKKLEKAGSIQSGLTLKGLRHTVATILAEMGKDSGTIQLVLGHAAEAMAKHYSRRADMTRKATAIVADLEEELNKRKTKNESCQTRRVKLSNRRI